jgi:hypothetical protein
MNEAETRAELIDPAWKAAGWGVVEGSRIRREHPIAPGRIEGHGKRGKRLTAGFPVPTGWHHSAGVAPKAFGVTLVHAPPIFPQPKRGCIFPGGCNPVGVGVNLSGVPRVVPPTGQPWAGRRYPVGVIICPETQP